jgi:hypothetical protein
VSFSLGCSICSSTLTFLPVSLKTIILMNCLKIPYVVKAFICSKLSCSLFQLCSVIVRELWFLSSWSLYCSQEESQISTLRLLWLLL